MGITSRDRKRGSRIRDQTNGEDSVVIIKKKKWTWANNIRSRTGNRWTTKLTVAPIT